MLFRRIYLITSCSIIFSGCSSFLGSQPPAPVHSGQQLPMVGGYPEPRVFPDNPIVQTQPLKESTDIPTEVLAAPIPIYPEPPRTEQPIPESTNQPFNPPVSSEEPRERAIPAEPEPVQPRISSPAVIEKPAIQQIPRSEQPSPFEPMQTMAPLSRAVGTLVASADQNTRTGDIDSAAVAIERAINIESKNPTLYYKLAVLRLKQSKWDEAEDLAKKSALLAASDNALKKHCWLLIAHARELQHDYPGAKQAQNKADSF